MRFRFIHPCFITGFLCLLLLGTSLHPGPASAQSPNAAVDYPVAIQLMRDGKYEEAYEILHRILQQNPHSYAVFERTVTALVHLKRYEQAITLSLQRLERTPSDINTLVKLGEIYHTAGNSEQAVQVWRSVIHQHPDNLHAYQRVAETMNNRRLFAETIEIYKKARMHFNDAGLYGFEIAGNYLAIGQFEPAINEYLDKLATNERLINQIQRQFMNYDERRLYDMAIVVTQERLERTNPGSDPDLIYRDFLVWLNMERGLYRRALAAARTLERYSNNQKHVMFRIGRQLRSLHQFELSIEAFSWYLDLEEHGLRARSYEEMARTWQSWAHWLMDQNLNFAGASDILFRKAFDTTRALTIRYPRYERMTQTLLIQAELALDYLKLPDQAQEYLERMQRATSSSDSDSDRALADYIEGRILLYKGEFSLARVALTRSNRLADTGETAEKTRYYLGLGDFYNGDFGFSRLQLRSLERINHSLFANNALRLRFLIQEAYREGEDNTELERFARGYYLYHTGQYEEAASLLAPVLQESGNPALRGETILLLSQSLQNIHPELAYRMIEWTRQYSPGRNQAGNQTSERLLWERARLADLLYMIHHGPVTASSAEATPGLSSPMVSAERLSELLPDAIRQVLDEHSATVSRTARGTRSDATGSGPTAGLLAVFPENLFAPSPDLLTHNDPDNAPGRSAVIQAYEDLLVGFSEGFYSDLARDRIRTLETVSREL